MDDQVLDALERFLPTPSARRATGPAAFLLPEQLNFYPRPPRGGRHLLQVLQQHILNISTHALREEGDVRVLGPEFFQCHNFYPRPPRGGRQPGAVTIAEVAGFLPTPSARRATSSMSPRSSHSSPFLPTPSARRATDPNAVREAKYGISTHALREEGDTLCTLHRHRTLAISTHALREEGDCWRS